MNDFDIFYLKIIILPSKIILKKLLCEEVKNEKIPFMAGWNTLYSIYNSK